MLERIVSSLIIFGNLLAMAVLTQDVQLNSLAAPKGFKVYGAQVEDSSGFSVSNAGDVNGDGVDDVLIGAFAADPPTLGAYSAAGIAYVIFGRKVRMERHSRI